MYSWIQIYVLKISTIWIFDKKINFFLYLLQCYFLQTFLRKYKKEKLLC